MKHLWTAMMVSALAFSGGAALAQSPDEKERAEREQQSLGRASAPAAATEPEKEQGGMMAECRRHCDATAAKIAKASAAMEEAKASGDTGKMRAALDDGQKSLAEMSEHMTQCRKMMAMMHSMGGMHSMMEGMHGGESGSKPDASKAPATVVDPVCGMKVDPKTAAAKAEYKGRTYYFCSVEEKERFEKDPQQYVNPAKD
jgi:Cu+-exporting ATPase